jgi:glycosyltransferase involved in cell wall biosynthesis
MISGTALIATVYQEGQGIRRWLDALAAQTEAPEEFVVVDGDSTDDTVAQITGYSWPAGFPKPRVIVQRCNIAAGRNLAIQNTVQPIIVSTDAGSFPDPDWLGEITRPLLEDSTLDVVGGQSFTTAETDFQQFLRTFEPGYDDPKIANGDFSSSRNIAFRRETWASVGGYPQWLTLAAEDALFNFQLRAIRRRMRVNAKAIVRWQERPTANAYFKMLYRNGFGAAEARMYAPYFLRRLLIAAFPPLLLLSHHRFAHLKFRYCKNLSSAMGWVAGKLTGRRPPNNWRGIAGGLLSPESQLCYARD